MAEAVVSMVIGGLIPLGNLVVQNATWVKGVGDQVDHAESELLLMRSYLKDADARQDEDDVIRFWVNVVREAAYDLEDAIESFILKVVLKREGSKWVVFKRYACCFVCNEGVHRYMIGSDIESITRKLTNLRLTMQSYDIKQWKGASEGGGNSSSLARKRELRLTYAHARDDYEVVGIDKAVKKLTKKLLNEGSSSCRMVSIWGMGGLGKTTLAKKVFNDEKIMHSFDCFAWVSVSQQFESIVVMKDIYKQLCGASDEERRNIADMNSGEIAEKLYRFQLQNKCLVVLDDIWTTEAWKSLKRGFPVNEEAKSAIILTTRNGEMASVVVSENGFSYESKALGEEDSWDLFWKIMFSEADGKDAEIKSRKEELGRNMLRQCAGLPLAIVVLAGLLSRKHTVDEWETVSQNVNVHIGRGTDIDREYTGQEYGGVLWILALSYQSLPYRLKLCFLYLSHYPEDYEISVKELVYFWMAEGFITSTSSSSEMMEDIAYSCLTELVARCMVQVGRMGLAGTIKTCRLHDLMRDLCLSKALEENFFHVGNFSTRMKSTNATQVRKVRRLAINLDKEVAHLFPTRRDDHLRSLLYFTPPPDLQRTFDKRVILTKVNELKLLRVLKLIDMPGLKRLPRGIRDLVHLRLLCLKHCGLDSFPSSIENLVCLQTLDLRFRSSKTVKIPNVFGKMEQLRHLYLPLRSKTCHGQQLTLGELQTLVNVEWGCFDLQSLIESTTLRKLFIKGSTTKTDQRKNLKTIMKSSGSNPSPHYRYLRSLSCPSSDIVQQFRFVYKLQLAGSVEKLPQGISSFPNLIKLKLSETYLVEDQIAVLEELPHLRALYLFGRVFSGQLPSDTLVCTSRGFPKLELICLDGMRNVTNICVQEGAMPLLRLLRIEFCGELKSVPEGLQHVANLKELVVKFMPHEFCVRLREGGEDFRKIKHVPAVIVTGTEYRDMVDRREAERATRRRFCL